MKRFVVDSSFLVGALCSVDLHSDACYTFYSNNETSTWIIPILAYFEYQATQSKLAKDGKKARREIYIPNLETYEITKDFTRKAVELDLPNKFSKLRGADLVFACVAAIENAPLVSCDKDFDCYADELQLINPTRL